MTDFGHLPTRALGLDACDLGVAAVIVKSRATEDHNPRLHAMADRLQAASWQLAPAGSEEGDE